MTKWEKFLSIRFFKSSKLPIHLFVIVGVLVVGAWVWYELVYGPF